MIVQRKKEREGRGKRKKKGRRERDFTYNEQGNWMALDFSRKIPMLEGIQSSEGKNDFQFSI